MAVTCKRPALTSRNDIDFAYVKGERGLTAKTMHWIIRSSAVSQFWTPDVSMIETTRLDR